MRGGNGFITIFKDAHNRLGLQVRSATATWNKIITLHGARSFLLRQPFSICSAATMRQLAKHMPMLYTSRKA
jgi:hypothetical protein